jgi:predicted DNA-binding transcriptional regulator YafY
MLGKSSNTRILSLMQILADCRAERDVQSLAAYFATSEKTIRRDIAELRSNGIVILESREAHNRKIYSIDKVSLPPLTLNFDETLMVFLGTSSLTAFQGSNFNQAAQSALQKLRLHIGELESKYLDKLLPRIHSRKNFAVPGLDRYVVDDLMVAIEDERAIFIEYLSAKSTEPLTYDIYPYGMAEHKGCLYVVGHSCHHNEIRTWKVDRILDAELTSFPFTRPTSFDLSTYFSTGFGVVTSDEEWLINVRFMGSAVRYVTDRMYHPSQSVAAQADGSVIVNFSLSSLTEIKSWILSFGSAAEVLEPRELRRAIQQELHQLQAVYSHTNLATADSTLGEKK